MDPLPLKGDIVFYKETITDLNELRPGDHIVVPYDLVPGRILFHHGMYIGRNRPNGAPRVAETVDESGPRMTTLARFTLSYNLPITRYNYVSGAQSPIQASLTASNIINYPEFWGNYHMLNNNCEHFVTYCKTGNGYSLEVERHTKYFLRHPMKLIRYMASQIAEAFCK